MLLARRGARVLVVDKASFPSETLSTHLLKPRGMAYLRRWGLRDRLVATGTPVQERFDFVREDITLSGGPSPEALGRCLLRAHGASSADHPSPPPVEWACVRRSVLDTLLVDAAVAAGVELRQGFRVEELLRDGDRIVGVRGRSGDAVVEERARVVVGADGRHSSVARAVNAPIQAQRTQCTFTVYSYYSGIDPSRLRMPLHLRGRLGTGFGPIHGGLSIVSVWAPSEWFPGFRSDMEANLLGTVGYCYPELEEMMRAGRREDRLYGTDELHNVLRRAHGPGWILVGDAGCILDQCTAIGMTHAMRDAQLAADAIGRGLDGEVPLDEALADYDARRIAELMPQFEYVSTVAECNLPTLEQIKLLAAIAREPAHIARFLGFSAAIVPPEESFSPAERQALIDGADGLEGVPTAGELAERLRRYAVNPWAGEIV
jgi:flavin-dependent dehydrogenase